MRRAHHHIGAPLALARAAVRQLTHITWHKVLLTGARRRGAVREAWFYPESPHPYSVVYRVCHRMGIRVRRGLPASRADQVGFLWQDDTWSRPAPAQGLINGACCDISKRRVEAVHQAVFGYGLAVDPRQHVGPMVCKADRNGAHDGQVVQGPLATPRADCVYQRLVDNRAAPDLDAEGMVCDLRVTIFGGQPRFVYLKLRPESSRFANLNARVQLAALADVFSPQACRQLADFCRAFGLDYGEIDVVRDAGSGRLHVLDVNKTPLGPPNGLSPRDQRLALAWYRRAFLDWFSGLQAQQGNS